jgi:ATPase subunit of ABC transporter with duplicated ATPase domains
VVFVSHDRYFLDRIADGIVEVREGDLHRHEGGYSAWGRSESQPAAQSVGDGQGHSTA